MIFFSHQQPNRPIMYGFMECVTVSQHGLAILCEWRTINKHYLETVVAEIIVILTKSIQTMTVWCAWVFIYKVPLPRPTTGSCNTHQQECTSPKSYLSFWAKATGFSLEGWNNTKWLWWKKLFLPQAWSLDNHHHENKKKQNN